MINFNTSNVTIQRICRYIILGKCYYFNTSNVTIQQYADYDSYLFAVFQYI